MAHCHSQHVAATFLLPISLYNDAMAAEQYTYSEPDGQEIVIAWRPHCTNGQEIVIAWRQHCTNGHAISIVCKLQAISIVRKPIVPVVRKSL